jgi:outer membrane protein OmpA-like peptidoglycan-associated protein
MKKQLLLIGLIFAMFTAFAQEVNQTENTTAPADDETTATVDNDFCPHRILFRIGGGYATTSFKEITAKRFGYTAMAEIGYTYFFHRNVGIGIGVGINHLARVAKITDKKTQTVVDPNYHNGVDPYDLTFSFKDFKQLQTVWAVEVPLTIQFEKKWGKNGIYAGIGAKGYFPFTSKVSYKDQEIILNNIWDDYLQLFMDKLIVHLDPQDLNGQVIKPKMRPSIDILGEFGGIFGISRAVDFYVGAYASYSFLSILPKDGITLENLNTFNPVISQIIDPYINTTSKKWNPVMVGLKVGFHFLPCKSCSNDDYMKDAKRKYMDEMMKKQKEPIIVTNTVEYYYFVPSISQELVDQADPEKKKALMELAQSLSNIKILFDLDKDIPKVEQIHIYHIDRAVEVLKANDDLKVVITGYTSPEGTKDHNQDLGHRRALAVRQIFINKGIPADQIAVQNYIAEDLQHKIDIPEKDWKEQRAVIFKIEKR